MDAKQSSKGAKRKGKVGRGVRSQAIRNYLEANPTATPKQVVDALHEQGIEVNQGLVSSIKYGKRGGAKAAKGRKANAAPPARAAAAAGVLNATDLFEAKKLVDLLGGVDVARQALDALEQLR